MSRPKSKPSVDLGYPTKARGRIPAFANVEEEAEFWDLHEFTDFAAESSPVEITVGQELAERRSSRVTEGSQLFHAET